MSQALATSSPANDLRKLINSETIKKQFAAALPKHLSPERFCRIASTAITRSPKLADCTQESFMKCLLDLSAMGLEPDGRRAHLIPYENRRAGTVECTLIIDWKGLAELAMRSGVIAKLHADLVCENDEFDFNLGTIVQHKINFRQERGDPYAAYAMAETKDGAVFVAVMTKAEIEKVRNASQGYKSAVQYNKSNPWITDPGEMWKKTCFRRLSKWLPLSAEFRDAVERDDEDEATNIRDITPVPTASTSKLFQAKDPEPLPPAGEAEQHISTPLEIALHAYNLSWSEIRQHLLDNGLIADLYELPTDCTAAEAHDIIRALGKIVANVKGGEG